MNCSLCRERLSPYLEGELSAGQKSAVEGHLGACTACRAELKVLQEIVKDLKELPEPKVPSGFRQEVWQRIEAASPWERFRQNVLEPLYFKIPAGAVAAAAVVLLTVQVTRHTAPMMSKPTVSQKNLPPALQRRQDSEELKDAEFDRVDNERKREVGFSGANREGRSLAEKAPAEQGVLLQSVGQLPKPVRPTRPAARIHVRLKVRDINSAHQAILRLIAETPMQEIQTPFPIIHHELLMEPERVDLFLAGLQALGKLEQVEEQVPEGDTSGQRLIVLDLVSNSTP